MIYGYQTTSGGVNVALALNGNYIPGSDIGGTAVANHELTSLSTIINVTTAPSKLRIFNKGAANMSLFTSTDGLGTAIYLTIQKLQ